VAMLEDRSNDLTEPALRLAPVIREVLTALEEAPGCRLARLSGSGATCFGLFDDPQAAVAAASSIDTEGWWVRPTRFRTSSS
ncbi:MAG: 4-(cytidine 5'-diphospho)-2-C-methyl-D-erythritol kinase, partial [Pseudomonadota bacterium]|nr:4-(cytidine 5'-diphospho)-2-C-methyl-D-erythritol kinase [Pseudomonadota bacterium]